MSVVVPPGSTQKDTRRSRTCGVCDGTGFETSSTGDGIARVRRCRCQSSARTDRYLGDSRVPKRYRDCSFDAYDELKPSLRLGKIRVQKFVEDYPIHDFGLLIMGPCGVGKTHLAAAALLTLIREKGVNGTFYDFRDLLKEIQASYNAVSGTTEHAILQPIFSAEVLVLDDLGATKMTDWARDTLSHIINNRYNERRVTIFTSNLDDEPDRSSVQDDRIRERPQLADQIGTALRSRLYEMCEVIRLEGDDYRKIVKHTGRRTGPFA